MLAVTILQKEYIWISENPPEGCSAGPVSDDDIFHWQAIIVGPLESPYEHGVFELKVSFPRDYPVKPPQVTFITPVYHPNIDKSGRIGLDILRHNWRPVLHLHKVLLSIMSFLADPDPNEPLVPHIAQQYISDRKEYNRTAREWTHKYASS
ncbi:hypothetical protein CHS0354_001820 [Potamilus streckersoni]|uniref:E2 ubiquitin-conjugating enzyme n=1 Tax=Potamilus streckersoni TaxID=2493646 RepID=A0AAE0S4E6_9BIVA|nr:hypothetical protein CHS0354_001820 [Potamilus streckersoni]